MVKGKTVCCCSASIIVIVLLGLEASKIGLGIKYLESCSIEKKIPIWLIVSGSAIISFGALFVCFGGQTDDDCDESNCFGKICGVTGFLFALYWQIYGSTFVYPNYSELKDNDFNPCTRNVTTGCTKGYCNETLITFAFAMATIDWILMGLWIVTIVGLICNSVCRA